MENPHFEWETHYKWPFSIAMAVMLVYQRVPINMAMAQKYGYGDPGFGSSGQRKGRKDERVMEFANQGH